MSIAAYLLSPIALWAMFTPVQPGENADGAATIIAFEHDANALEPDSTRQSNVRSEVIVRITPYGGSVSTLTLSRPKASAPEVQRRRPDRDGERCIALSDISGVRLGQKDELYLFLHNRQVYRAAFEKSCPVQGFYSGFYVEKPQDGLLCAGREALHARSGVDCTLGSFHEVESDK